MSDQTLVQALEERTRLEPQRVVRLRGQVGDEPFELLIFRGFSSSTTHPTAFDPDASVLPEGTSLDQVELLQGPLSPTADVGVVGMLTHISFVVPAALAFGSTCSAHFDHREVVVLAGQKFGPGFAADLQL